MPRVRLRVIIPGLLAALACLSALGLWSASPAHACTCVPPPPPDEAVERSEEVFAGTVVDINEPEFGQVLTVRFAVGEAWKGVDGREVEVATPRGGDAACGYRFQQGSEYLVYTAENQSSDGPKSVTGICQRTADLANAGQDLDVLGEGTPGSELAAVEPDETEGDGAASLDITAWLLGGLATLVALALMALRLLRR